MDVTPTGQDPATADDELAKVLAGVSSDPTTKPKPSDLATANLQFEETPGPAEPRSEVESPVVAPSSIVSPSSSAVVPAPAAVESTPPPDLSAPVASVGDSALESIKKSALEELRPLVDKLNLSPEEKFDTVLLIIRSTDDHSLVGAAHEAAKSITDETKRAQALLDVIKEIDYFGSQAGS